MAKTEKAVAPLGEEAAPAPKKRKLILLVAGGVVALCVAGGGGYAFSGFLGAGEAHAEADGHGAPPIPVPMPVATVADAAAEAGDYQIVSLFDDEAILATRDTLVRLKVGSQAPGLGTVTAIHPNAAGGGTLTTTQAVLKAL
ncbi:flagellar basal body-associated FliL family protein [Mangrovibrevibacter kandeliae]|uniref:hypothetical protein n=1 Tax=Mangrovibrevibacter kandeliae TaxID=2968473 RepID=UPI0021182FB6|nr:hypothetical protein [Aurantimonas sp. CSK15Z-1]MCQ8781813.1 hypothetical protein [Aurantimonas sp. CSK15Z-1]